MAGRLATAAGDAEYGRRGAGDRVPEDDRRYIHRIINKRTTNPPTEPPIMAISWTESERKMIQENNEYQLITFTL